MVRRARPGTLKLRPFSARVLKKLFHGTLADEAVETHELWEGTETQQLPAITLPGELDRIRKINELSTDELQNAWMAEGVQVHPPTIAYRLRNVLVMDGSVYGCRSFDKLRDRSRSLMNFGEIERFQDGQLCTAIYIERFFGHWITDGLPLEILAHERQQAAITLIRAPWMHEVGYREIISLRSRPVETAYFENLWIVDDRGLNRGRIGRLEKVRSRVRQAVGTKGPTHVFIRRGNTGVSRALVNEEEIVSSLEARGFTILNPEASSARQIAAALTNVRIVVLVEGSAQGHVSLCAPAHCVRVMIQPPERFNAIGKAYSDGLGQRFAIVVPDMAQQGFYQPLDALLRTIELAERSLSV
jgi:capsular polysaccharide biosynthesis protein